MSEAEKKLTLEGFNNLSKTLSLSIYDLRYVCGEQQLLAWYEQVTQRFGARRLNLLLWGVAESIGAEVLSSAHQDYDPQGASVALMIAEEPLGPQSPGSSKCSRAAADTLVLHLDKSHITAHTYPDSHISDGICNCRVDIEVSTCGLISPLGALNPLIRAFDCDVVAIDYRVRGFTRDVHGRKHFMDSEIHSIQSYIDPEFASRFQVQDQNLWRAHTFHTRMRVKAIDLRNYLFCEVQELSKTEQRRVRHLIRRELAEIFVAEEGG